MRALERCDFCDDGPARVYEVVPPELEPTPSEQRRVALCEGCRIRVERLLEPLLDRLDPGGERGSGYGFGTGTESEDGADGGSAGDGVDTGRGGESHGTEPETAEEPTERGSAGGVTVGYDASGDETADSGTGADETADSGTGADDRPPRAYGKLLRLLRNREFPMDRDDVEGLAAGAYDLEREEVEAIVDHAVERGELVEDGRRLRRG